MIETNHISESGLFDLFKKISHRRQSGILRFKNQEEEFAIKVVEGIFDEIIPGNYNISVKICAKLREALALDQEELCRGDDSEISKLFHDLVGGKHVSEYEFIRANRAVQLDLIFECLSSANLEFEFVPRVVRTDPRWALSLSPSQLLLDFLEYYEDYPKYVAIFGELESNSHLVAERKKGEFGNLTSVESTFYYLLEEPLEIIDIFKRVLYSRHEVIKTLLSLFEMEAICLRSGNKEDELNEFSVVLENTVRGWFDNPAPEILSQFNKVNSLEEQEMLVKDDSSKIVEDGGSKATFLDSLLYRNLILQDPKRIQVIVLTTVLFFLFVSALILPEKLQDFFYEISKFSFIPRERMI